MPAEQSSSAGQYRKEFTTENTEGTEKTREEDIISWFSLCPLYY